MRTTLTTKQILFVVFCAIATLTLAGFVVIPYLEFKKAHSFSGQCYESQALEILNDISNRTKLHLQHQAKIVGVGQAAVLNLELERIADELDIISSLVSNQLNDNKILDNDSWQKYITNTSPKNNRAYSRFDSVDDLLSPEQLQLQKRMLSGLHPFLKLIYEKNDLIGRVYIATGKSCMVSYPWRKEIKEKNPRKLYWFRMALRSKGGLVWLGPYTSHVTGEFVMTCTRGIKNSKGKIIAVVAINIDVTKLTQKLANCAQLPNAKYYIVNSRHLVLAAKNIEEQKFQWWQHYRQRNSSEKNLQWVKKLAPILLEGQDGHKELKVHDGSMHYFTYCRVPAVKWFLLIEQSSASINATLSNTDKATWEHIWEFRLHQKSFCGHTLISLVLLGIGTITLLLLGCWGLCRVVRKTYKFVKRQFSNSEKLDYKKTKIVASELLALDGSFSSLKARLSKYLSGIAAKTAMRERLDREMLIASQMQKQMLPEAIASGERFDLGVYFEPVKKNGGGFYNFLKQDERRLFFFLGDVKGHGFAAAMFMTQITTILTHMGRNPASPAEVLNNLEPILAKVADMQMSVSLFCGVLELESGQMRYSFNGKNLPIWVRDGKNLELQTQCDAQDLQEKRFVDATIQIEARDTLLFYTDGIFRITNSQGKTLPKEEVLSVIYEPNENMEKLLTGIVQRMQSFKEDELVLDDIILLALRYLA